MSDHIVWTLDANVNDGKADDLVALLEGAATKVQANEPGTLTYEFFFGPDRKTLHALERYADSASALAHLGGFGEIAEQFMACVEMTGFNVYGSPSDAIKEAIAGFQPVYHTKIGGFTR